MFLRISRLAIFALATATACTPDYGATNPGNQGLVSFKVPHADTADGATVLSLIAKVDTSFRANNTAVTFTTTTGKFLNGNQTVAAIPDSFGVAHAFLTAPRDSSTAFVTASAGGVVKSDSIVFAAALPRAIILVASPQIFSPDVKAGAESTLTATLIRSPGLTSPGGEVQFEIIATNGLKAELGAEALPADTEAKSKLVLMTTDKGTATVRARYVRNKTIIVQDTVVIRLPQ